MINLIPMPNYIQRIKSKVSFSNYQIIIEQKYENAVSIFNNELENHLKIDENSDVYSFEFIFNKNLKEEMYLIHMDRQITHIEGGSMKAFFLCHKNIIPII